ncbi:MAG: LytTR family DNA-binding domain-containing protein [Sphingomicrobium sp.]
MRALAGELVVLTIIGVILAALGPFGSFELGGFDQRLAYWLPAAFLGYAIFRPIAFVVILAADKLGIGEFPAMLVAVAIAAFPASAGMMWLSGIHSDHRVRVDELLQLYIQVALIGGLIGGVFVLISRRRPAQAQAAIAQPAPPAPPTESTAPEQPFLDRLPVAWRNALVALEMEDHYVRAHGAGGHSILILMRMADAERELSGTDGARVHRSWWVMRRSIAGVIREGRGLQLDLDNGLRAPVSRDRLAALKMAGWPI